ncbi:MAG: 2-oxoacid:ferredoxin oxidoreductase subunit beta [Nitrospirae bacterium]|nr:MAG: 2-oxoacid:ferredoxin oxidoreductase subunit beta [Nitrospirota bacterium]
MKPTIEQYKGQEPAWCPGCGNFSILETLKEALVELEIPPYRATIVSGIGQAGKLPHYMKCNTFNGLHGRTLPVATGIRLVNPDMLVIAVAGDGDCYGEGGNHLLHAIRRNINVKLFVHNNQIYGLTKGQASPTSTSEIHSKTQPFGVLSESLNPIALAVALDCSFVARGYAGAQEHLKELMKKALLHRGFALLDILQPCVTFNRINTYQWYSERVRPIGSEHDPADRKKAFELALRWGDEIPIGIFYINERDTMEEQIPVLKEGPLFKRAFSLEDIKEEYIP